MKLCIDCKFMVREYDGGDPYDYLCTHVSATTVSPVHGDKRYMLCEKARKIDGADGGCGLHGKHFHPK